MVEARCSAESAPISASSSYTSRSRSAIAPSSSKSACIVRSPSSSAGSMTVSFMPL